MSMMFLLKNFKIVEQDVKKSVGASSSAQNLAFMTAPSTSSTNDVNTANLAYEVSTVSPNVNTACPQVSTANFSDNTMFAFRVENPNGSNLLQQDIEQIQEDDLEKNGFEVAALSAKYDKSKVECFNCHKMGHFARECRAPRNKEGQFRYQDNTRKQGNNEDTSLKAMLAINSVGFDWSDMAGEQVQTNMALMAFSNSEGKLRKEGIEFKIEKFDNASKSLDKLLWSQITEKSKKDLGYDTVPLPHPLIYNGPTKLDLSYSGLDEFKDPKFKSYGSKDKQVLEDTSSFVKSPLNVDKETVFLVDKKIEFVKPKNLEKPVKRSVRFDNKSLDTAMRHYLLERPEQLISARSDNGTEFKNKVMDDFCREKGIKREYRIARTPQQNSMAERRNMTLIKAARTMLADSKLPTTFWAKAVSTACYVQNRVLVVKPYNKTPYELFRGFKPALSFMRPFGCHVIILNTLDNLGKFDSKSDEGFFVGYSLSSKAFRVYNTRTRRVEENLHIGFLENKPMIEGNGPKWLFDIDSLTQSMNYVPCSCRVKDGSHNESDEKDKSKDDSSPKEVNVVGQHVNTASPEVNTGHFKLNTVDPSVNTVSSYELDSPKDMFKLGASHTLEATHVEFFSDKDEPEVDLGNITNSYTVPTTPNTRIHKDHPIKNMIGDVKSSIQTRRMTKSTSKQGFLSDVYEQKTHVWKLVDLPNGKRAIGTKWVFRNKKDERGIVIRNKSRIKAIRLFLAYASFMGFLVYQMDVKSAFLYGTIEEEVYVTQPLGFKDPDHPDKVYKVVKALYGLHQAPRAWYETLANYLLGNEFKRGKIDQTLFIKKQKGDILLVQVYVDDIIFGSTNKEMCTAFKKLIKDKFQMSSMGELTFFLGLQVTHKEDRIFISQDKYVAEILKKFNYTDVKSASTLVDLEKPLVKDGDADDVDVHLYRSMIGSLMYLTASRPNIMFACKKQTVVATSITEAEYVAAASCYGQQSRDVVTSIGPNPWQHLMSHVLRELVQVVVPDVKNIGVGKDSMITYGIDGTLYKTNELFWGTTTARTTNDGEVEIIASIDGQVKTITEVSLRRHLKLEDSDDFPLFPTMITTPKSSPSIITSSPSLSPQTYQSPLRDITRQDAEIPQSHFPTQTQVADEAAFISVDVDAGGAATIEIGLEAGQGSGTIHKTPTRPHDSPLLRVYTLGSDEGSLQQNELMDLVTKLTDRKECRKEKDKGKAFMKEDEDVQKKTKKDAKIAKHLQEEFDRARQEQELSFSVAEVRKNMCMYLKNQGGYKQSHFKGMSYEDIRPIFKRVWDQNNAFVPKDSEIEKEKLENDAEKKELRDSMDVVPRDDIAIDVEYDYKQVKSGYDFTRLLGEYLKILFELMKKKNMEESMELQLDMLEIFDSCAHTKIPHTKILTLGSDEGGLQQNELMDLVTKLTDRVEVLENGMQRQRSVPITTTSATPEVSTTAKNLVYIRRSAEKRKDKGKAIMKEDESVQKKTKKQLEQERLGMMKKAKTMKQEVVAKDDQAHDIDLSDPVMLRYHALQNRSFFIAKVRKNLCMYLKNQGGYKQSHFKGISYEDIRPIFERVWDQNNAFVPKDSEIEKEKQKLEDDVEKKEPRDSMDVVPRDDIAINVESIATKYPIVDWKTHILFKPNEEDEIWKNQQDYNLISWRLFDSCGIHMLLMHTGIAIHMMIEKKYPLTQEMLSRMLSRILKVDQESEMAFELLRFTRSQLQQ
ncbi:retrovirus-related pol polyprotein from transposon TNT 1-94 [Tanacetum coccineum]